MNAPESWQQSNARQLAGSLALLRRRLESYAEQQRPGPRLRAEEGAAVPADPAGRGRRSFFGRLLGGPDARPMPAEPEPLAAASTANEASLVVNASSPAPEEMPSALAVLGRRLGLSPFEEELLLLCASTELDTRVAGLCARAHDDPQKSYPTFALAFALFDDPAWDVLSPERPLRRLHLIEVHPDGATPLTASPLRADERVVSYLKGLNCLDDRLASVLLPLADDADGSLPNSQQAAADAIERALRQAVAEAELPIIQLAGPDPSSKQLVAVHAAAALGVRLYRLPAETLPSQAAELETFVRLWQRESLLLPLGLYLDVVEPDVPAESEPARGTLHRFLARHGGLVFLDTRDVRPDLPRRAFTLDIAKPLPAEQQAAWRQALGESAGESPALLAAQFNLGLAAIRRIAQPVPASADGDRADLQDRLWRACLADSRPRLDSLAQRLQPKATWDDIVLPSAEVTLLHQIAEQVRRRTTVYEQWGFARKMSRGLGISSLFAGDSGTGKTMAAEVIANELKLDLYRIDLSAVVSKYIGETEKNLRRLFDAAEDGGAILFFDEADALFGKRSEVKDSHDRYANIEVNYLLQRMESYRGLAILATNMKTALDQAFVRRLRFIVNFPFPGFAERRQIWRKVFPADAPLLAGGLELDRLARLNLAGGSIHNVALNAAFLAASAGSPVTMPLVLRAAREEFCKQDRPVNESDFGWGGPSPQGEDAPETRQEASFAQ